MMIIVQRKSELELLPRTLCVYFALVIMS